MNESLDIRLAEEQRLIDRGSLTGRTHFKYCKQCGVVPAQWPTDYCVGCGLQRQGEEYGED